MKMCDLKIYEEYKNKSATLDPQISVLVQESINLEISLVKIFTLPLSDVLFLMCTLELWNFKLDYVPQANDRDVKITVCGQIKVKLIWLI